MNKLYNIFLNLSSCFTRDIINIVIQYSNTLFISLNIKSNKKISAIRELNNNRIAIGFYAGNFCIHNLLDGTRIINNIKYKSSTNQGIHITSICQIADNIIICALLNKSFLVMWNFENNTEEKINISKKYNLINDLTHLGNDLIGFTVHSLTGDHAMYVLNYKTYKTCYIELNVTCFAKNNELIAICKNYSTVRPNINIYNISSFTHNPYLKSMVQIQNENDSSYPVKIVLMDNNNYIVVITRDNKDYLVITSNKQLIMKSQTKIDEMLYINNNIIILSNNKVYVYNVIGELLQTIQHHYVKYMKIANLDNKLVIADNQCGILIYGC
jgi:hypothetical protein